MDNTNLFLIIAEAGKPKVKVTAYSVSGKNQLIASKMVFLHHVAEEVGKGMLS